MLGRGAIVVGSAGAVARGPPCNVTAVACGNGNRCGMGKRFMAGCGRGKKA